MTWAFFYLAFLIVGLVLAAAAGSYRRQVSPVAGHRHLAQPRPSHTDLAAARLSAGLVGFGLVGLAMVLTERTPRTALVVAGLAGVLVALAAVLMVRQRCPASDAPCRARVARPMPPGGYGQVRFEQGGQEVVLAAHNVGSAPLEEGAEVEVVRSDRSVLDVRRASAA